MSDDARTILKRQAYLASLRTNFDSWWQDIALRVLPAEAQFTTTDSEGTKRMDRLFDSSAAMANERFAAVMEDLLTARTQRWHGLKPPASYAHLLENQAVRIWYEQVRDVLFAMRYSPRANFASQKQQGYEGLGAFGNSAMFIDEKVGDRISPVRYISCHMSEITWAQDEAGLVNQVYRKFPMQAGNAVKRFGNQLPEKIRDAAENDPYKNFDFIHCTRPNEERVKGRLDYRGMPWASYYVTVDGGSVVQAGGYRAWPWSIGRYKVSTRETYGRSPAMLSWPAIMTLQEQKKTVLRAGQTSVHPPVLLTEEGGLDAFSMRPGALNAGLVSDKGEILAHPFKTGADVPLGLELMQLEKQDIKDAFLQTIFEVLVQNPQMTATQVLEVVQQRGVLLAPTMGRQMSEDLGPMVMREFDVCSQYQGMFPPLPDELLELNENNELFEIEYTSPLARAMRAPDAIAIQRTLEVLPQAIAVDPTSAYVFDIPQSMREVAEINGYPAKLIRDKDQVEKIVAQKQQADQAAQLTAAAPDLSQAALNAAKAESLRSAA